MMRNHLNSALIFAVIFLTLASCSGKKDFVYLQDMNAG